MLAKTAVSINRRISLSPLVLAALAADLAAMGINAPAADLLRFIDHRNLVSRPDLSRGADGSHS